MTYSLGIIYRISNQYQVGYKNAGHDMALVWEPCNVDAHANIHDYVVPMAVCTHVLYTLIVTVQLAFLSDQSEHRMAPGNTTQTPHTHTHTESNV